MAGAAVRALCIGGPLVLGIAVAVAVAHLFPSSTWWVTRVASVAVATLAGSVVLLLGDRAWRRLLPLASLLRLSLAFPDRAPSRVRVALRAGSPRRLLVEHGADSYAAKVLALAAGLTVHDRATRGHSERVRAYAELIADELRLSDEAHDRLRWAALLHDIGKVTVPADTLNATHPLSDDEWEVLRHHPEEGERLTEPLKPWLGDWALAVAQHHERYDGGGYPRGLAGDELSLAARIVTVADSFDAMTTARSYSKAMLPSAARERLVDLAGSQFDPGVVRAFLRVGLGRIRRIVGPAALIAAVPVVRSLPGSVARARQVAVLGTLGLVSAVTVLTDDGSGAGRGGIAETAGRARTAPPPAVTEVEVQVPPGPPGSSPAVPGAVELTAAAEPSDPAASPEQPEFPGPSEPPVPCQLRLTPTTCVGAEVIVDPPSAIVHAEAAGLIDVTIRVPDRCARVLACPSSEWVSSAAV